MWYFAWVLGMGFALSFGVLNAMWYEARDSRGINGGEQSPPRQP